MRLEHSLVVERPVDEVFAFLADPQNLPRWQSDVLAVRAEAGARGVGARHIEVRRFMGRKIEQTLEVTAYEPGRRLDLAVVQGPLSLRVGHTLAPDGEGTRIEVVGEGELGPLFWLAEPLVLGALRQQSRTDFARLKRVLEETE
jgi:uncharacterized protein YndB with AHSA1/START domain